MTIEDDYIDRVLGQLPRATPMRAQIAMELRGHIAERVAHGSSVDDVLRQLGDPTALAESYLAAVPLVAAPFLGRVAAKFIDMGTVILFVTPALLLAWATKSPAIAGVTLIVAVFAASLGFGLYTVVAEAWLGTTVGKRMMGMRVVRESGAPVGLGRAIVRQMPMFFQFYCMDVLFALFTDKRQRAFELLSKTRVVKMSPV